MLKKEITITNDLGLHARPAAIIAKAALKAKSDIWIEKENFQVDASSMIDILTIACQKGSKITLVAESDEDLDVFEEIKNIIEEGFGE